MLAVKFALVIYTPEVIKVPVMHTCITVCICVISAVEKERQRLSSHPLHVQSCVQRPGLEHMWRSLAWLLAKRLSEWRNAVSSFFDGTCFYSISIFGSHSDPVTSPKNNFLSHISHSQSLSAVSLLSLFVWMTGNCALNSSRRPLSHVCFCPVPDNNTSARRPEAAS